MAADEASRKRRSWLRRGAEGGVKTRIGVDGIVVIVVAPMILTIVKMIIIVDVVTLIDVVSRMMAKISSTWSLKVEEEASASVTM